MQKHTHYWIDRKGAYDAAVEIVGTNLHLEGDKLDNYLNSKVEGPRFDNLWKKIDVLGTGWIEIERMAMFYKTLMDDYAVSIQ